MLFSRRNSPSIYEKVRIAAWPRRSWMRSARYVLHRLWRLSASPHKIALGCAAGIFVSCTPFLGFHFILAGLISWTLRGSILASALGTFFGTPLTFPLIWITTFNIGNWFLGASSDIGRLDLAERLDELRVYFLYDISFAFEMLFYTLWPIVKPMIIGAIPVGLIFATIGYFSIKKIVEVYQSRRQKRIDIHGNEPITGGGSPAEV